MSEWVHQPPPATGQAWLWPCEAVSVSCGRSDVNFCSWGLIGILVYSMLDSGNLIKFDKRLVETILRFWDVWSFCRFCRFHSFTPVDLHPRPGFLDCVRELKRAFSSRRANIEFSRVSFVRGSIRWTLLWPGTPGYLSIGLATWSPGHLVVALEYRFLVFHPFFFFIFKFPLGYDSWPTQRWYEGFCRARLSVHTFTWEIHKGIFFPHSVAFFRIENRTGMPPVLFGGHYLILKWQLDKSFPPNSFQIALAIGVLNSSIGVRARIFFYSFWGGCRAGCGPRCRLNVCAGEGSQILIRFGGASNWIRKGVLNQHVGIQPTVFRFSYVVIDRLPRHP